MSTSQQVRFGLKWVSGALAVTQGLRFLTTIVLARLLVPEMFGVVAMANVTIQLIGVLRQVGLGSAYIQRRYATPEEERLAANTTFYLSCAVNGLLFLVAWPLSPLAASFFRADELLSVLRVLFLAFVLDAFLSTPSMILQKRLEFGKHALSEIGASLGNALLAISLAVAGFGVWSLVAGQLAAQGVQILILLRLSRFRPRLEFSRRIARDLFSFGKFLWAFGILSAVGDSLDRLIIGRALGAASLGIYSLAFNLCKMPARQINNLVNRVTFPAFSTLQEDRGALAQAFLKTLSHVSILAIPMAFGIVAVTEPLVLTLYGPKWADAVPVVQVLAFYGTTLAVSSTAGPLILALGKSRVLLYTSLLHHSILVLGLLVLGRYGVVGIATAVLIPIVVSSAIAFALIARYLSLRAWQVLEPLTRATAASLLMFTAVRGFEAQLVAYGNPPMGVRFASGVVVGGASYLLLSAVLNRPVLREFATTVRQVLGAKGELV